MAYCTRTDLIRRFSKDELEQLTDRNNLGQIDDLVLDAAIADADAEIDAKLQARYTLPLSPVPQILNLKACDIARYFLYDDGATDQVTKRYNDAITYLKDVRDGKEQLGVSDPAPASGAFKSAVKTNNSAYDWETY